MAAAPTPQRRSPQPRNQGPWEKYWPRAVSVIQAGMGTAIGLNEAFGTGRPYVLAFSLLLFSGAPATEAMIKLLMRK